MFQTAYDLSNCVLFASFFISPYFSVLLNRRKIIIYSFSIYNNVLTIVNLRRIYCPIRLGVFIWSSSFH